MSKRSNGEGTIRKRADGRWEGRVAIRDGNRKLRRSVYGSNHGDCRRLLNAAVRQMRSGVAPGDHRVTVEQFLNEWIATIESGLRPTTRNSYRAALAHIVNEIGQVKLLALSPQDVNAMLMRKAESGLSARTLINVRAVLRAALNHALRWQMVERNVAALSVAPRAERRDAASITPEEAKKILQIVRNTPLDAVVALCLMLGLRLGEVLGLTWECVDFDRHQIHVRRALHHVDGHYDLAETKTNRSRRVSPLSAPGLHALERAKGFQDEQRRRAGRHWHEAIPGLIFTTDVGQPRNPSTTTHRFTELERQHGMRHRTMHELRQGCATLLLAQGVDIKTVSTILGHSQIGLTANTYTDVLPALSGEAISRLDDLAAPEERQGRDVPADGCGQLGSTLGSTHQTEQGLPFTIFVKASGRP